MLIYVSTDDPAEKLYANFIAAFSGLPRDYCENPYFHKKYGLNQNSQYSLEYYDKYSTYKNYIERLIENKKLIILDVKDKIDDWREVEKTINEVSEDKDLEEKYKVLIFDSVNKVTFEGVSNENEIVALASSNIKKLCERNKVLAFLNFELNKVKNNAKLSQYNLTGSKRMNYDANVLAFIYNPTRNLQEFKGTDKETRLVWQLHKEGKAYQQPILFTIQEKSKCGNNEMNAEPYFYRLNNFTSELTPIEVGSEEHYYYYELWKYEWENLYQSYRAA